MRTATAIILGVCALAVPAQAQEPAGERPQPGCSGLNFTDPRGDVDNPGLDIVSGYLTTSGGTVFANLVVANLDGKIDQSGMAEEWFVAGWTTDSGSDRAAAHLHADGTTDGGSFFTGQNGVVQMALPGVSPTTPIRLWAYSGADREPIAVEPTEDHHVAAYFLGLTAEEIEGNVQSAACPTFAPAPPQEEPAAEEPAADEQPVQLVGTRIGARAVRLTLRSPSPTTVRATLSRAGRVVARASARIDGAGTLVLSSRRALRRGAYTLRIPGVTTQRLTVR